MAAMMFLLINDCHCSHFCFCTRLLKAVVIPFYILTNFVKISLHLLITHKHKHKLNMQHVHTRETMETDLDNHVNVQVKFYVMP